MNNSSFSDLLTFVFALQWLFQNARLLSIWSGKRSRQEADAIETLEKQQTGFMRALIQLALIVT